MSFGRPLPTGFFEGGQKEIMGAHIAAEVPLAQCRGFITDWIGCIIHHPEIADEITEQVRSSGIIWKLYPPYADVNLQRDEVTNELRAYLLRCSGRSSWIEAEIQVPGKGQGKGLSFVTATPKGVIDKRDALVKEFTQEQSKNILKLLVQGSLLMNRLLNSGNEVAVEEIFGKKKIPTTRVKTMYYRTKYQEVCTIAAGYVVKRIRTVSSKPILASPSDILSMQFTAMKGDVVHSGECRKDVFFCELGSKGVYVWPHKGGRYHRFERRG